MSRVGILFFLLGSTSTCGKKGKAEPETLPENTAAACANSEDDDQDGLFDCLDPDCAAFCGGDSDTDVDTDTDSDVDTDSDEPDPCDVLHQTGCEGGQACKVFWNKLEPDVACANPGDSPMGQVCDRSNECEGGLTCWQSCRPACRETADCTTIPGGTYDFSRCIAVRGWGYCTLPCDPLVPESCGGGATCMLLIDGEIPTTDCVRDLGELEAGEDCMQPTQCVPGTACDEDGRGGFTCALVCEMDDDCTDGETCSLLPSDTGAPIGTCR